MNFLDGHVLWSSLNSLRSTTILKVGYLGAFAAPIYAHLVNILNKQQFFTHIPFPDSLLLLFAGSLILSLGHIFNEILCPALIAKHGSIDEYRTNLATMVNSQIIILKNQKQAMLKDLKKKITDSKLALDASEVTTLATAVAEEVSSVNWNKAMGENSLLSFDAEWKQTDKSMPAMRAIICLLYAASAAIALILVSNQICAVTMAVSA